MRPRCKKRTHSNVSEPLEKMCFREQQKKQVRSIVNLRRTKDYQSFGRRDVWANSPVGQRTLHRIMHLLERREVTMDAYFLPWDKLYITAANKPTIYTHTTVCRFSLQSHWPLSALCILNTCKLDANKSRK